MDSRGSTRREEKVQKIFERFDVNRDGGLNREEIAALVIATNKSVKFSNEQIDTIYDEIFRTYEEFFDGHKGLTSEGLLVTYDDGAGDVDRDFDALGLHLNPTTTTSSMSSSSSAHQQQRVVTSNENRVEAWVVEFPSDRIVFDTTWEILDALEISIARLKERQRKDGRLKENFNLFDRRWSRELEPYSQSISGKRVLWNESGRDYAFFLKELNALRARADEAGSREEVYDGHIAIGRFLYEQQLLKDALTSFRRTLELDRTDARSRICAGNCLCLLGRFKESKEEFLWALEIAEVGRNWDYLLPLIYINLGIVLEKEHDKVSKACENYREAIIYCPTHFRASKLLGSALFRIGEYEAAAKALEAAIFLNPDYADAHCDLGLVLHETGRKEEAREEYQKALDLMPGHVNALYNMGVVYMERGKYRMASEMCMQVLEVWPNNWRAMLNRAVALAWVGGEGEEDRKAMKEGFKMSYNVESHEVVIAHIKQLQQKIAIGDERMRVVIDETMKSYIKFIEGQRGGGIMSKCLNLAYLDDAEAVELINAIASQPNPEPSRGLWRRVKQ